MSHTGHLVYRPRRRRRKKKKKKSKWPLVIFSLVVLVGLGMTASLLLGFNPLLEGRLKTQFGEAFFSDFEVSVKKGGSDLDSIVAAYEPAFEELEDKAAERLNLLYHSALEEYRKQERSGNLNRFTLTNRYIQAGRIMESSVDEVFYDMLEDMENELVLNGHSTEITAQIEATYKQTKDEKRRDLLSRLRNEIGE